MNENIDLTKILEGCPKGTEFYHAVYGRVWFKGIIPYEKHPIRLALCKANIDDYYTGVTVSKKGTHDIHFDGECIVFPSKEQRDWSKFVRFWDEESKANRFDPKTLQPFDKILVRNGSDEFWRIDFFRYFHINSPKYRIEGFMDVCHYGIPYNDDTKHLADTTEDCSEYYKWWEE